MPELAANSNYSFFEGRARRPVSTIALITYSDGRDMHLRKRIVCRCGKPGKAPGFDTRPASTKDVRGGHRCFLYDFYSRINCAAFALVR